MNRQITIAVILSALATGAVLNAIELVPQRDHHAAAVHTVSKPLILVYTGEGDGHLTPCGCSKPMVGGLLRRGTFLARLEATGLLLKVENGDLVSGVARQDELKAETTLDVLNTLGYQAVNLGERDFRLGLPMLRSLQARFHGAMLCANARNPDGSPAFEQYARVSLRDGARQIDAMVVGLLSDRYASQVADSSSEFRFVPSMDTLAGLRPVLSKAQHCILLYHGPTSEAREIARAYPYFSTIVCAHEGDSPMPQVCVGATTIVAAGEDGKYVGFARFSRAAKSTNLTASAAALTPDYADDARVAEEMRGYLARVSAEDLLAGMPRTPLPAGQAYAGSAKCAPCHVVAMRMWHSSGHGHATMTLERIGEDRDPECIVCHAVGADRTGGFVSRSTTPGLTDVGCESCHGPAAAHVRDPSVTLARAGKRSCDQCHVPEHSPRFQFAAYWARIRH